MKYEIKREIRSEPGAWLDSGTVYECETRNLAKTADISEVRKGERIV